ncbi:hypothetical protein Ddye_011609 [Dipteronia dyeriana]|uniref:Uncharacterized protein n=1 Tax=Dipteronia dyeriana TaxID=168575 RepID=A0AAD9X2U3_9ROSI|nr:hypothetical protein Ddye_011609 [Dipteronia dyeriana]
MFLDVKVEHIGFHSSDQHPLLLRFGRGTCHDKIHDRSFRFESFWLKEEDLGSVVGEAWGDIRFLTNIFDFRLKLNWCAAKLYEWSKERFGSLRKLIDRTPKSIKDLYKNVANTGIMDAI